MFTTLTSCTTPSIPASATGTATGQTTASLSWTAGNPAGSLAATYYWVVGTSPTVTYNSGVAKGMTSLTTASATGLTVGTFYYLRVYAKTSCDESSSGYITSSQFKTFDPCIVPISPDKATASKTTIINGQSSTLQVVGGALNSAPYWIWYSDQCGGNIVGTGETLVVLPKSTPTYYVQAIACGTATLCRSVTINVCEFSTSNTGLNFNSSAGSKSITVESNTSWSVFDDASWITASPYSGINNGAISVNVTGYKTINIWTTGTVKPVYYHQPLDNTDALTPEIMEDAAKLLYLGILGIVNN